MLKEIPKCLITLQKKHYEKKTHIKTMEIKNILKLELRLWFKLQKYAECS